MCNDADLAKLEDVETSLCGNTTRIMLGSQHVTFRQKKNILPRKTGWVFNFVDDDLQNFFRQDEERFGPNLKLKNRMSHHFNKQQSRFQLAPQRTK